MLSTTVGTWRQNSSTSFTQRRRTDEKWRLRKVRLRKGTHEKDIIALFIGQAVQNKSLHTVQEKRLCVLHPAPRLLVIENSIIRTLIVFPSYFYNDVDIHLVLSFWCQSWKGRRNTGMLCGFACLVCCQFLDTQLLTFHPQDTL